MDGWKDFLDELHKRLLRLEQMVAGMAVKLDDIEKSVQQLQEQVTKHNTRLTLEEGRILAATNRRHELLVLFAGLSAIAACLSALVRFF